MILKKRVLRFLLVLSVRRTPLGDISDYFACSSSESWCLRYLRSVQAVAFSNVRELPVVELLDIQSILALPGLSDWAGGTHFVRLLVPPENQQQHPDDGCDDTAYDQHSHARGVAAEGGHEFIFYAILNGKTIKECAHARDEQKYAKHLSKVQVWKYLYKF